MGEGDARRALPREPCRPGDEKHRTNTEHRERSWMRENAPPSRERRAMEGARDASAWSASASASASAWSASLAWSASASPVALAVCALALAMATRWAIEFARASAQRRAVDERERHELYRAQRARALERAEEELRRAANERASGRSPSGTDRDAKLAEIDAKAARLGLRSGRKLGGSSSSRPEWNPLAGGSESRGYRPARRTPPGGGG